jgi:cytoskeletal protein RodZ
MTFICDDSYNCIPYECSSEVFTEQLSNYFENLEQSQKRNCDDILTLNSYLITFLFIALSIVTYNYGIIEKQLNFYRKKYLEIMESESESESDVSDQSEEDRSEEDQSDNSEEDSEDGSKKDSDDDLVNISDSEKTDVKTTRSGWFY